MGETVLRPSNIFIELILPGNIFKNRLRPVWLPTRVMVYFSKQNLKKL
jgi:hypothetical protein